MVQYIEKFKKTRAIDMRKRGLSYSLIGAELKVPKSTLSYWLKNIKLNEDQLKKMSERRLEALRRGSEKRISKTLDAIEDIKKSSAKNIKKISKRELWLVGIVLYWRERFMSGGQNDLRKGVRFSSSDPYLVKLFLKWLQDVGQIKDEEIIFDIFIEENKRGHMNEVIDYWVDVTEFPRNKFSKVYFLKTKSKKKKGGRDVSNKTRFGLLRARVRSSSMLARQIHGWVRGIIRYYWD